MKRRRRLPLILISVATLLAFLAIFAIWANRQLLNTENWTETSSELLENDAIREQVSIFLVDELYANVDVQDRIEEALPPRAAPLAPAAANGLKGLAQQVVDQLLQRPRPQALWERANSGAHAAFLSVVEGGGDVVSTEGGDVTLDLKALLGQTQERVGVGGRAEEKIPEDAGQLTVFQSDDLELAQDMVDLLQTLAWLLLALALGLYALAIYLAHGWRREALRATGIGFLIAGLAVLVLRPLAGDAVVGALAKTQSVEPAIQATWDIGTSLLREAAAAAVLYGIVIVFSAWLAGPMGAAVATRRELAPYLREPGYAYGGLLVLVLGLLAWGPTPALRKPLGILLIVALLVAGLEVLRRQAAREHPDASVEESTRRMREWFADRRARAGRAKEPAAGDRLAQLEQLGKLRDSGVIDKPEFEREKERILGHAAAPTG